MAVETRPGCRNGGPDGGAVVESDESTSIEVAGYRADTKTMVVTGYSSRGNYWHLDLKFTTDAPEGLHYGMLPDGRTFKGRFKTKKVDQNNWEWHSKGKSGDGKELEITGKYVRKTEE